MTDTNDPKQQEERPAESVTESSSPQPTEPDSENFANRQDEGVEASSITSADFLFRQPEALAAKPDIARFDSTSLVGRQAEIVRLKVSSLEEAQSLSPPVPPSEGPPARLPDDPIAVVDTIDIRAALSLVAGFPQPIKRIVFFGVAESGEATLGRPGDQRTALRLLRDTFATLPSGVLIIVDPGHRGRGVEFWARLQADAPAICTWLDSSGAKLMVVRVNAGSMPPLLGMARLEAPALPLVRALCLAKNISEIDPRVQDASPERLRRFVDVLAYDDDGEAYFEELEAATNDAERLAREEADRFVREFFVAGRAAGAAAVFTAAQLPRIAFSDFQSIVSDILTTDAFAPKKDEPAPVLDDATLDAVGLRRARVSMPNQSPVTTLRFTRGTRFAEIVRSRVEAQAPVFSGHAFAALQARATIGALKGEAADLLAERAAVHIVANGGGDIDKLSAATGSWLASSGIATGTKDPALQQRSRSAREQLPRLLLAAARGFAAATSISRAEATAAISLNLLQMQPACPSSGGDLARAQAQSAYVGLFSGASEARILALVKTAEAASPVLRWLIQAFVGDNFGLSGSDLPRPSLEGIDRLLGVCLSELLADGAQPAPRRRFLEAICIRAICLRVQEDSERICGEAPPEIDADLLTQLVRMSTRPDGVGGGFLSAERTAAEKLDELNSADRTDLLGKSSGGILLTGSSELERARLVAAEAAFRINTTLASALFGADVCLDAVSLGQAFNSFALEIQRRSSSAQPEKVNYAAAGLWREDFTQNPHPFAKVLATFSRHTAELRALGPAVAAALATAHRIPQTADGETFAHVRCIPEPFSAMAPLDRADRQNLIEAGRRAAELAMKSQEAWRGGLEHVESRPEQTRLIREARARFSLLRTFASAVRNIGLPTA